MKLERFEGFERFLLQFYSFRVHVEMHVVTFKSSVLNLTTFVRFLFAFVGIKSVVWCENWFLCIPLVAEASRSTNRNVCLRVCARKCARNVPRRLTPTMVVVLQNGCRHLPFKTFQHMQGFSLSNLGCTLEYAIVSEPHDVLGEPIAMLCIPLQMTPVTQSTSR